MDERIEAIEKQIKELEENVLNLNEVVNGISKRLLVLDTKHLGTTHRRLRATREDKING